MFIVCFIVDWPVYNIRIIIMYAYGSFMFQDLKLMQIFVWTHRRPLVSETEANGKYLNLYLKVFVCWAFGVVAPT